MEVVAILTQTAPHSCSYTHVVKVGVHKFTRGSLMSWQNADSRYFLYNNYMTMGTLGPYMLTRCQFSCSR